MSEKISLDSSGPLPKKVTTLNINVNIAFFIAYRLSAKIQKQTKPIK